MISSTVSLLLMHSQHSSGCCDTHTCPHGLLPAGVEEEEEEEETTGEEAGGALVSVTSGEHCQINIFNIPFLILYIFVCI